MSSRGRVIKKPKYFDQLQIEEELHADDPDWRSKRKRGKKRHGHLRRAGGHSYNRKKGNDESQISFVLKWRNKIELPLYMHDNS